MFKQFRLAALVLLVSFSAGVLGAAAQDRLSAIFNVGQGAAGSKAMVFDSGNGSSNAQVASTANTNMSLKVAGVTPLSITSTGLTALGASGGGVSDPPFTFSSDTDTGFYRSASGEIAVASNGTAAAAFSANYGVHVVPAGDATTPSFSYNSDPDTGVFNAAANILGFAGGGAELARLSSAGLSIAGSGPFKVQVYTGTLSSGATITVHDSGTVIGAFGWSGAVHTPIAPYDYSTNNANIVEFALAADNAKVAIKNSGVGTSSYGVVVFYQ